MSDRNGRTRVQFTIQELEALRTIVCSELRLFGTPGGVHQKSILAETLGGILMKVSRASNRIKTQEKDK